MMKVSQDKLEKLADKIAFAEKNKQECEPIRSQFAENDLESAYAIQTINIAREKSKGRVAVGKKIGLTSKAVQKQLGVDQPDFGTLFADMVLSDGEEIPYDRVMQPKVEAEVALVLASDLNMQLPTIADLISATDYVLPAIEIVGSRIKDWDIKITDTIADNASCGLVVLGTTPKKLAELDLRLCGMVMESKGEQVSVGAGVACLGSPLNAALWLARKMVELGQPLRAGDILLTGALGPMVNVQPNDRFEARISGLGAVRANFGGVS
ncbi:MAG: 2-keto-4-pentenoate hydratase [Kangiellaceae bacterium]|nr:2-keto-4-pentenoate hydratase [Kangiellaceae bacterium]